MFKKIENHSESEPENYFTRVANSKSGISSLNVEELTGQTDNRTQVQQRSRCFYLTIYSKRRTIK